MKTTTLFIALFVSIFLVACNASKQSQTSTAPKMASGPPSKSVKKAAELMQQLTLRAQKDPELAFFEAVRNNDKETIATLLASGAKGNKLYFTAHHPIYYAVNNRDIETIQLILKYLPTEKDNISSRLLGQAAGFGETEILALLLASITEADLDKLLDSAIVGYKWHNRAENLETVKFLLKKGATDKIGAINNGILYKRLAIVEYLLNSGVDANDPKIKLAFFNKDERIINLFLDHGYKIKDEDMLSAVYRNNQSLDFFPMLISKGGNIHAMEDDKYPDNVISKAVTFDEGRNVQLLIDHGADINSLVSGRTPIIEEALTSDDVGAPAIVKMLLEAGVDPTQKRPSRKNDFKSLVEISVHDNRNGATINLDSLLLSMIQQKKLSDKSLNLYTKAIAAKADKRALVTLRNLLFLSEYLEKEPARYRRQFEIHDDPIVINGAAALEKMSKIANDLPQRAFSEIEKGSSGFTMKNNIKSATAELDPQLQILESESLSKDSAYTGMNSYNSLKIPQDKAELVRDLLFDMHLNTERVRSL